MEIGNLLFEREAFDAAIPHFDRIKKNPELAGLCVAKITLCLACKSMFDLAWETQQDVDLNRPDEAHLEEIKGLLYKSAGLFEFNEKYREAHEIYKRLFKLDAGYRQIVQRLESLSKHID